MQYAVSLCVHQQLESQVQQHQLQWKAAHEKWVAQDTVIKNTVAQVNQCRSNVSSVIVVHDQFSR
jgi:hypothetical protein